MPLTVAIVGAGPAGCYAAEAVARATPDARIDVIERLPVPYGLVRHGVAPDHQGTKAVTRVLERTLARPTVRVVANVTLGRDVLLVELLELYDAVVLAIGASHDRALGIPGADLPGVVGSGAFVGWYNGHPDHGQVPPLATARNVVIVGNGNVALDVARILAKTREELASSDIATAALDALANAPLQAIHIVGRRAPDAVRFSPHELGELGDLARALPRVAAPHDTALREMTLPTAPPDRAEVMKLLQAYARNDKRGAIDLVFHFELQPLRIEGEGRAVRFVFARGDEEIALPADLVIGCIGYHARPFSAEGPVVEGGCYRNEAGRIAERLYAVGWAARGASGVIPNNRADGLAVAKRIIAEVQPGVRPGPAGLDALLASRGVRHHDFAACKKIESAELAAAKAPAPRRKFATIEEMLAAIG
ncbi:MAG TPA: FAD-dependent oxidoreductase [Alphaproteobacteria bacterium]|nr:FAD-dependent oxidoreductase [Alphaproteobacteria bacterium]